MNRLRRTKTDTITQGDAPPAINRLRRTKTVDTTSPISPAVPKGAKPTRTKSHELRRTKTDATPHIKRKKERRPTDIQAFQQAKTAERRQSSALAAGVMAGAMREMDPQSIIDMLEAYAGDDDDRDMAFSCLENLKKSPHDIATAATKSPGKSPHRGSRTKRVSNKTKLRQIDNPPPSRPLAETKGDWGSVSITDILNKK
ncbi:expressed unknown protein [Seminavis robusta]|uniref:Uncharacterized protein n=1 Tax=Seminavis robusta TaxID=568900 RepID=A0A9N8HVX9_9STRA|nr:expressed unknown protein [Seminavis robusta]|eukprot:Sro2086_g313870.1 n/a (200) ;mRNA; f:11833-12432